MDQFLDVEAGERAPQRLRRRALDLADEAIGMLDPSAGDDPKRVHDLRRRFKELRALTFILGDALPARGKGERDFFRDAGRKLSSARDSKAALEAFDRLREHFKEEWRPRQFLKIRRALASRVQAHIDPAIIDQLRSEVIVERGRIAAWPVDEMRREDLWRAVARSYRRARRAMRTALEECSVETMHEWRKQAKIHWYHEQFLTAVNLARVDKEMELLQQLSRKLGQHHDLVLIDILCSANPEAFGTLRYVRSFRAFIRRRLAELQEDVERAGEEVFAERVRAWMARVRDRDAAQRPRVGPKKSPARAPSRPAISA